VFPRFITTIFINDVLQSLLLVEIGPEGGRRHNSPLIIPLPFEGRRSEAPLGSGRRNYSLATAFTPLPILHSVYFYVVTSTNRKKGRKKGDA
jgi:hypothetical protein